MTTWLPNVPNYEPDPQRKVTLFIKNAFKGAPTVDTLRKIIGSNTLTLIEDL